MSKFWKYALLLAAIWLGLYGAGKYVGKSLSPDFTSADVVKGYVAAHVYRGLRAGAPIGPSGGGIRLESTIAFRCGDEIYGWVPRTRTPFAPAPKDPDWLSGKYQRVRFGEPDALVVAGVLGIPTIKTVPEALESFSQLAKSSSGVVVGVMAVGLVTGGVLGFWRSWKPDPDCASPELQRVVRDPDFWNQLGGAMSHTHPSP